MLLGTRLEEAAALEKISEHARRMAEMEDWFVSVKAEAAAERQMREQVRAVFPSASLSLSIRRVSTWRS